MTQEVVITLSKDDLIKVLCEHFDLQKSKTAINFKGDVPRDIFPTLVITSDRVKQSDIKQYNQLDR